MKIGFNISIGVFCLFLWSVPGLTNCPSEDLTGDCYVDLSDFAVLASQWLSGYRLPSDMVWIPGSTFRMGNSTNPEEGNSNELPVHTVTLDSFAMGKYEITNKQYCAFLNTAYPSQLKVVGGIVYASGDTTNSFPYCDTSTSYIYSQIAFSNNTFSVLTKGGRDMTNDPMVAVSWYGAVAYCNWRSQQEGKQICYNLSTWNCDFRKKGYRLPTEAEWEYAARGGLIRQRFSWGMEISHLLANYYSFFEGGKPFYPYDVALTSGYHPLWNDGIEPHTSPVGSFPPNGYGLYDMTGNASEWCNDWYSGSYYSSSPTNNPIGPEIGSYRVLRGGCWSYFAFYCRVSFRDCYLPTYRGYFDGCRVVLDLN